MIEIEQSCSKSMLEGRPSDSVVEISIFGPGRGESIAVHLGDGRWIIVDSCIEKKTKTVPVLDYLSRIGVDAAEQVRLVVATHAHDDHFAGISRIFDACRSADFVCPSALTSGEFFALTDIEEQEHLGLPIRAYSEYRRIFDIIEAREIDGFGPLQWAYPQRHVFTEIGSDFHRDVIALSPSDKAFKRAMRALRKVLPVADRPGYIEPIDPNELAIALWVEAGDKRLLLGADLLKGPKGSGWNAVMVGFRPDLKAEVFKVPHHGSGSAYLQGVWSGLLVREPLALLTPFRGAPVPSEKDRQRILGHTSQAYRTAPTKKSATLSDEAREEAAAIGLLRAIYVRLTGLLVISALDQRLETLIGS